MSREQKLEFTFLLTYAEAEKPNYEKAAISTDKIRPPIPIVRMPWNIWHPYMSSVGWHRASLLSWTVAMCYGKGFLHVVRV